MTQSLVRLEDIVVNLCIIGIVIKMPVGRMITNVLPSCIAASCILLVLFLPSVNSIWLNIVYAFIALLIYFIVCFREKRYILF